MRGIDLDIAKESSSLTYVSSFQIFDTRVFWYNYRLKLVFSRWERVWIERLMSDGNIMWLVNKASSTLLGSLNCSRNVMFSSKEIFWNSRRVKKGAIRWLYRCFKIPLFKAHSLWLRILWCLGANRGLRKRIANILTHNILSCLIFWNSMHFWILGKLMGLIRLNLNVSFLILITIIDKVLFMMKFVIFCWLGILFLIIHIRTLA